MRYDKMSGLVCSSPLSEADMLDSAEEGDDSASEVYDKT